LCVVASLRLFLATFPAFLFVATVVPPTLLAAVAVIVLLLVLLLFVLLADGVVMGAGDALASQPLKNLCRSRIPSPVCVEVKCW